MRGNHIPMRTKDSSIVSNRHLPYLSCVRFRLTSCGERVDSTHGVVSAGSCASLWTAYRALICPWYLPWHLRMLFAALFFAAAMLPAAVAQQLPPRAANNTMVLCASNVGEGSSNNLFYLQVAQVVTLRADAVSPYRLNLNCAARFTADPSVTSNASGFNLRVVYLSFYTENSYDKWTLVDNDVPLSSLSGQYIAMPPSYTTRGPVLGVTFTSDSYLSYPGVVANISLVPAPSPSPTPTASQSPPPPPTPTQTPSIPPTPSQTATQSRTASATRTPSSTPVSSGAVVMCNSSAAGTTSMQTVAMTPGVPLEIVSQPSNMSTYPASALCQATLVAPPGTGVRITVRYTDLQYNRDVLRVYDGPTTASPLLFETSMNYLWAFETVVPNSTSSTVLLSFTSDISYQATGVRMLAEVAIARAPSSTATPTPSVSPSFSPAAPGSAVAFCPTIGGTNASSRASRALNVTLGMGGVPMTVEAFTNTGPTYPAFIACALTVFGPPGTLVQATITAMRTVLYDGTTSLINGPNVSSPGIMSTSGIQDNSFNAPTPYFASGSAMTVTFTADQGPPGGYGGVRIVITAMAPTPSPSVTPSETPIPPNVVEMCGRASGSTRYAVRQLDAQGGGVPNGTSLTVVTTALDYYPTYVNCYLDLLAVSRRNIPRVYVFSDTLLSSCLALLRLSFTRLVCISFPMLLLFVAAGARHSNFSTHRPA